jgi:anti-sigma-K factor RskA
MNKKSDITPEHDVQILAGEYVLGTLSPERRAEVQQRMAQDPALRRAIQGWEARLLAMTDVAEPEEPAPSPWQRLGNLTRARRASGKRKKSVRWLNSIGFWRKLAIGSFIAALLFGTQLLTQVAPTAKPAWMALLSTPEDKTPGWVIQISDAREVQLIPLSTAKIPEDKLLQFWTDSGDQRGLVSLGRVRPGEVLRVKLNNLPALHADQLFELTLENAVGPIAGKPGGPIQFIGRTVKVI